MFIVEDVDCVLTVGVEEVEVESSRIESLLVDGLEDVVVIDSADVNAREVLLPEKGRAAVEDAEFKHVEALDSVRRKDVLIDACVAVPGMFVGAPRGDVGTLEVVCI